MSESLSQAEQDDLEQAIALSLQPTVNGSATAPIELDSSSDEAAEARQDGDDSDTEISDAEELAKRVAARKTAAGTKRKAPAPLAGRENGEASNRIEDAKRPKISESTPSTSSGASLNGDGTATAPPAGLTRAQMERERLARQAARESGGIKTNGPKTGYMPPASSSNFGPRVATLSSISAESTSTAASSSKSAFASSSKLSQASLPIGHPNRRYWKGICRPTASRFHSGYECFSFKDVIGDQSELVSALLTTFCGDPEWLHSMFDPHVNVFLVMPAGGMPIGEQKRLASNMILFNPRREADGRGCMHIKLVLLYYKTFLRVAVATANLIDYDWSTIENAVYVQDFPEVDGPAPPSPFLDTLLRTHQSLGTPFGVYKTSLLRYDFSAASDVRLVLSIPGNYKSPSDIARTGHTGMATALAELGLDTPAKGAKLSLECQGSSTAAYTLDWLRTFYRSCLGWDPLALIPSKAKSDSSKRKIIWKEKELPDLKIVYPTFQTVKESLNGTRGGGTIFCDLKNWNKPDYPRSLFYDSRSQRKGLLQHTKQILGIVRPAAIVEPKPFFAKSSDESKPPVKVEQSAPSFKPFGWLYIGSHNFSLAAWGRYTQRTGNLSVSNHELGVIIPLRSDDPEAEAQAMITWKRPAQPYGPEDTPWDQHEYRRAHSDQSK